MIRVLVAGAAGRMGREVVRAVSAADGMEVVGAVDPGAEGTAIETGADGATIVCSAELTDAIEECRPTSWSTSLTLPSLRRTCASHSRAALTASSVPRVFPNEAERDCRRSRRRGPRCSSHRTSRSERC